MAISTRERLVSEHVKPLFQAAGDGAPYVAGEPLVPQAVVWRGNTYPVLKLLASGRGLGPCTHGSGEQYVRKHWYRFETTEALVMRVYVERRPRSGGKVQRRWWLYTVETAE